MSRSSRNRVFVSYSRADASRLNRLQIHLKPLERRELIDLWDDTRLLGGETRQQESVVLERVGDLGLDVLAFPDREAVDEGLETGVRQCVVELLGGAQAVLARAGRPSCAGRRTAAVR